MIICDWELMTPMLLWVCRAVVQVLMGCRLSRLQSRSVVDGKRGSCSYLQQSGIAVAAAASVDQQAITRRKEPPQVLCLLLSTGL